MCNRCKKVFGSAKELKMHRKEHLNDLSKYSYRKGCKIFLKMKREGESEVAGRVKEGSARVIVELVHCGQE